MAPPAPRLSGCLPQSHPPFQVGVSPSVPVSFRRWVLSLCCQWQEEQLRFKDKNRITEITKSTEYRQHQTLIILPSMLQHFCCFITPALTTVCFPVPENICDRFVDEYEHSPALRFSSKTAVLRQKSCCQKLCSDCKFKQSFLQS